MIEINKKKDAAGIRHKQAFRLHLQFIRCVEGKERGRESLITAFYLHILFFKIE